MSFTVRCLAYYARGGTIAYSVERRRNGSFFNFKQGQFRPLGQTLLYGQIPPAAFIGPLAVIDGSADLGARFDHDEDDEVYIIGFYRADRRGRAISSLPDLCYLLGPYMGGGGGCECRHRDDCNRCFTCGRQHEVHRSFRDEVQRRAMRRASRR
jgi:hypothetical protein